jgi:branched-chain amino acid transport system permease protein
MDDVVQVVKYGATIGSVYALVAIGYSLIFSTTRIVNFAQGTLVVVGGYLAWWLYARVFDTNVSIVVVTLIVLVASGVVGLVFDLVAVEPLGRFDPATNVGWLVTTFAAAVIAQGLVQHLVSSTGQSLPGLVDSVFGWRGSVTYDVSIVPSDVLLVGVTLAIVIALGLFRSRTRLGHAFDAVAQDPQVASLMGISPRTTVRVSFILAGVLTGLSGVLMAPLYGVRFNIGLQLGVAGFVAAVIGGLGSTRGAVVGGYLVGFVEGMVGVFSTRADTYRPIVVFAVFVIVLALRPTGLLGRPIVEKV